MRAAVYPRREATIQIPGDYNRCVTSEGTLEVTRVRELHFQSNEAPDWPAEDPLLFQLVDFRRAVDIERNPRAVRPREIDQLLGLRSVGWVPYYFVHIALRSLPLLSKNNRLKIRTFV